ncbi:MAG: nicotinate-nucleotide--dimethylbenzimidazole phosphoribosyltransferase [Planctomycetota bacterium]
MPYPGFTIHPIDTALQDPLQSAVDSKTKPPGSLGRLEELAVRVGLIQNTLAPKLKRPAIVVYAGDHGIAREGVSPFPQEVTAQMVLNFLAGGAAINVFARHNGIELTVVDAGVNYDFGFAPGLVDAKVARGTKSFLTEPAMTPEECAEAVRRGGDIVQAEHRRGTNIVGFGEMGIGNTSCASVIMSLLGEVPLEQMVGPGTGLDPDGVKRKCEILARAVAAHDIDTDPWTVLQTFGGFEIAMMAGGMLRAVELGMVVLVDGFIVTASALVAAGVCPAVTDCMVFAHRSAEPGHRRILDRLGARPLLDIGMRLGEGTGAAVALPLVHAAVNFLNEMATFDSAGVSTS